MNYEKFESNTIYNKIKLSYFCSSENNHPKYLKLESINI